MSRTDTRPRRHERRPGLRRRAGLVVVLALVAACTGDDGTDDAGRSDRPTAAASDPAVVTGEVSGNTAAFDSVAQFTVVLATEPAADVVVPVASSDEGEGIAEPSQLTFTATDWSVPQMVVVRGADDAVADGQQDYEVELGPVASDDPDYDGLDPDDVVMRGIVLDLAAPAGVDGLVAGVPAHFTAEVTYTGIEPLTFALAEAPDGMTIDAASGLVSWTPGPGDEGESVPVSVTAADGTRSAETAFEVEVLAPEPLEAQAVGASLTVADAGSDLEGVSITDVEGAASLDGLALGVLSPDDAPQTPDAVTPLTDVMVVRQPLDADIELRYPLADLPEGVDYREVELYSLTQPAAFATGAVDGPAGPAWTSVGVDTTYEGTSDEPVLVVSLARAEGLFVFGYGADGAARGAEAPDATEPPTTTAAAASACTQRTGPEPRRDPLPDFDCPTARATVTVRNWGSSVTATRWGGTTLDELVSYLATAQDWFAENQIGFASTFTVQIEDHNPRDFGWVEGDVEAATVLHLAHDIPKDLVKVIAVHEYMHHAQIQPATKREGLDTLPPGGHWLMEATARWFEDELYDDANSYLVAPPGGWGNILETGLAPGSPDTDIRNSPYLRFAFVKMLDTKCPDFAVRDLFSTDPATDQTGLRNLAALLPTWKCDFGPHLGAERRASLEAALVSFQYATMVERSFALLDANEPATGFTLIAPRALRGSQPDLGTATNGVVAEVPVAVPIARAGALTTRMNALAGTVPEGKELRLVVTAESGTVVVSVAGDSTGFAGTTTLGPLSASWFSTASSNHVVIPGPTVPELFITLANPSTDTVATNVKVSVTLQDVPD